MTVRFNMFLSPLMNYSFYSNPKNGEEGDAGKMP